MPIISIKIIKIIVKEKQKKKKKKQSKKEVNEDRKQQGDKSFSERVTAKLFCCMFKLGF